MISVFERIRKYLNRNNNSVVNAIAAEASTEAVRSAYTVATQYLAVEIPYYGRVRARRKKARKAARAARRRNRK